jgi:hypothetical protein
VVFSDVPLPKANLDEPVPIVVRLALPLRAPAGAAAGVLQICVNDVTPATVSVSASVGKVAASPKPLKLKVTRWLGPLVGATTVVDSLFGGKWDPNVRDDLLARRHLDVQLLGPGADRWAAGLPTKATLSSDRGGRLYGQLLDEGRPQSNGTIITPFRVDSVGLTGKYAGEVLFDGAQASPQQVGVEVDVQDAILYPLLVLLGAAGLGGYLIRRYNLRRQREILQAALKDSIKSYRDSVDPRDHLYRPELPEVPFPAKDSCAGQEDPIPKLYCSIYQATSDDDFTARVEDVEQALAPFETWHEVVGPYRSLRAALEEEPTKQLPADDVARLEAEALLDAAEVDPETPEGAKKLAERLRGQTQVVRAYAELRPAWEALPAAWKLALPECGPERVYKATPDRDAKAALELRIQLHHALRRVQRAATLPPPQLEMDDREERVTIDAGEFRGLMFDAARQTRPHVIVTDATEAATAPIPAPPAPKPDERTARQMLTGLRRWDWAIALGTTLVAAIAYLLPVYGGHSFGSWEDYLKVFAVGFIGSAGSGALVLNWDLFPSLRTYRPEKPKSDDDAAAAPAADGAAENGEEPDAASGTKGPQA